MTGLLWFKADDKCNQVEKPAGSRNPGMIEKGPWVVTVVYQLTKQQMYLSVTLDDSSIQKFLKSDVQCRTKEKLHKLHINVFFSYK